MSPADLDTRFETLRERVAVLPVPDAAEVTRRGQRRRTGQRVLAGALTLIALAVVGVLGAHRPAPRPVPLHPPMPSTAPWDRPGALRVDVRPHLVDGYDVHGLDASDGSGEYVRWAQALLDEQVTVGPGGADRVTGELGVFADESTARAVFEGISRDPFTADGFAGVRPYRQDRPDLGDEAVGVTGPLPADGSGEFTGRPLRVVAVRVGVAVALFTGYPVPQDVDSAARMAVAWLCPYRPACPLRAGLPAPLATLTDGGTAWAVAVDVQPTGSEPYGKAVAALAELGYRAQQVSLDCDEGARPELGETGTGARYVVAYFAAEPDAAAVARALPTGFRARPVPVRTHCT
jgi:hypothetical protein